MYAKTRPFFGGVGGGGGINVRNFCSAKCHIFLAKNISVHILDFLGTRRCKLTVF